MPAPKGRPRPTGAGRKPRAGTPATQTVRVALTDDEMTELDRLRGETPRSEYMRNCTFGYEPPEK